MIINSLDLGAPSHPWPLPVTGQNVGSVSIEGFETINWARGSIQRTQHVSFWVKAWQGLGGAAANSSAAMKYLLKQLEELASNPLMQPAYIQWASTADSAASYNATELHDGWYIISDFEPDYTHNVVTGLVQCHMTVVEVAPAAPRTVALAYQGAALSSNYSGTALNMITLPYGSTALEGNFPRTVAGGLQPPSLLSPVASPEPFVLPTTIANIFEKGRVAVYDTINTSSNPVPSSGGTYVNANWVEVFYPDHDFTGDCVITNGLLLLLVQVGSGVACYLWNTATATANWQLVNTLQAYDQSGNGANARAYSLIRGGLEEAAISITFNTAGGQIQKVDLRLQRGRYEYRVDLTPLTQAETINLYLNLVNAGGNNRITYNPHLAGDAQFGTDGSLAVDTQFGYGAEFIPSTSFPFIFGWLYQNQPGTSQPFAFGNTSLTLGDTAALAINAKRSYGVFAIPYGVNASYSTANLQAEAESGTLGTGWTSQANASASAGNEAKCASGTATTNADLWGTAFVPDPGTYDLWMRIKVTSAASGTVQMQLGLWNSTDSVYVASTTYAPNQFTTSYAWYRVAANVTPTATKNMRVRAVVATNATNTDWFIDESALVPHTLTTDNRGPQDIWQQFMYDRGTRLVRP